MTLREAIEQAITLGERDPHEIAVKIRARYDDGWLATELVSVADDVIADLSRQMIASSRRSSLSLARVGSLAKRDLMLQAAWLPGIGWVEFGKFKAEDFDRLAGTYRKAARALDRYAAWCESSAALMRAQGVAEFRQVKGELPALPPAEEAA